MFASDSDSDSDSDSADSDTHSEGEVDTISETISNGGSNDEKSSDNVDILDIVDNGPIQNMCISLYRREIGAHRFFHGPSIVPINIKLDDTDNNDEATVSQDAIVSRNVMLRIIKCIKQINIAYDLLNIKKAHRYVKELLDCLNSQRPDGVRITNSMKIGAERELLEFFIQVNGIEALLRLFEIQMANVNFADNFPSTIFTKYKELWIITCNILKGILNKFPSVSARYLTNAHIEYFFTLLFHKPIQDCCVNLIEASMTDRLQPINISLIPRFDEMLMTLDILQTARFCRLLTFLVFNTPDKRNMENQKFDVVACMNIINANQICLLENSIFLDRLILMLNILTYSPSIEEKSTFQGPYRIQKLQSIVSKLLNDLEDEWPILNQYHEVVKYYKSSRDLENRNKFTESNMPIVHLIDEQDQADSDTVQSGNESIEVLRFKSENLIVMPPSRIFSTRLMTMMSRLTITEVSCHVVQSHFDYLLAVYFQNDASLLANGRLAAIEEVNNFLGYVSSEGSTEGFVRGISGKTEYIENAKFELEYYALSLLHYHLDILFIISNLMHGERKHYFKTYSGKLCGVGDTFLALIDKMTNFRGTSVITQPVNRVRVYPAQYLSTVRHYFEIGNVDVEPSPYNTKNIKRILHHLISVALSISRRQPSIIWFNICIGSFVRNSNFVDHQQLVQTGIIENYIFQFLECDQLTKEHFKSGLDLLGEIIVGNYSCIELIDTLMSSDEHFSMFLNFILEDLADTSLKFIKAVLWTISHKSIGISPELILSEGRKFMSSLDYVGPNKYLQERNLVRKSNQIISFHVFNRFESRLLADERIQRQIEILTRKNREK